MIARSQTRDFGGSGAQQIRTRANDDEERCGNREPTALPRSSRRRWRTGT
jgi:hypothetical protein